jgi:cytoplasmic iron level regulating protein YaaA (DUF328/UPF0246 family)
MITLLTPSKTMDFVTPAPSYVNPAEPFFMSTADKIRHMLAQYDSAHIMRLMHVSEFLANEVMKKYGDVTHQKPALWTYIGDVFKGFQAMTLDREGAEFAQRHLLIASSIYGVLRPYDVIRPYRLEMKAKLSIDAAKDLYEYWRGDVSEYIASLPGLNNELCVLSSQEYARAVISNLPKNVRIITPAFIDRKPNGVDAQVPIYNKMMRGAMARWIVDQRIDSSNRLHEFSGHGYNYDQEKSTAIRPVFYRKTMKPLVF